MGVGYSNDRENILNILFQLALVSLGRSAMKAVIFTLNSCCVAYAKPDQVTLRKE